MEASGPERAEFRLAQAGQLAKRPTYKKLLTGIMSLLPSKGT